MQLLWHNLFWQNEKKNQDGDWFFSWRYPIKHYEVTCKTDLILLTYHINTFMNSRYRGIDMVKSRDWKLWLLLTMLKFRQPNGADSHSDSLYGIKTAFALHNSLKCHENNSFVQRLTRFMEKSPFFLWSLYAQLVKTFPQFYKTRRFISVHWPLSWTRWIQSTLPIPACIKRSLQKTTLVLKQQYVTNFGMVQEL
jgi:hypothetical protein